MNRRKFIKRLSQATIISGAAGIYAWQIEPYWLEFVELDMPIRNLPNHLIGKTVMQISDTHVSNHMNLDFLKASLQKAQKFNPDFVAYTGDYVSFRSKKQYKQLEEVLEYAPRGKYGSYAILGNHDYGENWSDQKIANTITHILGCKGIKVLSNDFEEANGLLFFGIDEFYGPNFNPEKALNSFNSKKASITLCHNPDVMDLDVWGKYNSWVLSGHTHGGQCKAPLFRPPILPVKNKAYIAGQYNFEDGRTLYINRALGHLWQIRFNVRPEITVFKLKKA